MNQFPSPEVIPVEPLDKGDEDIGGITKNSVE